MRKTSRQSTLMSNSRNEKNPMVLITASQQQQMDTAYFTQHYIDNPETMWHATIVMTPDEQRNTIALGLQMFPETMARLLAEIMPPDCLF